MSVLLGLCLTNKGKVMGVGSKNCATPRQQRPLQTIIFKKARNG